MALVACSYATDGGGRDGSLEHPPPLVAAAHHREAPPLEGVQLSRGELPHCPPYWYGETGGVSMRAAPANHTLYVAMPMLGWAAGPSKEGGD